MAKKRGNIDQEGTAKYIRRKYMGICQLTVMRKCVTEFFAPFMGRVFNMHIEEVIQHLRDVLQRPFARHTRHAIGAGVEKFLRCAEPTLPEAKALDRACARALEAHYGSRDGVSSLVVAVCDFRDALSLGAAHGYGCAGGGAMLL